MATDMTIAERDGPQSSRQAKKKEKKIRPPGLLLVGQHPPVPSLRPGQGGGS